MYMCLKRTFDFVIALIGVILLSPIFLFLIILIKVDSKGPVFFKQRRVGLNKSYFNIIKFRTMKIDTPKDTPTHLLTDSQKYITKVGVLLRKTSLDELPQIFNIISGSMSIIGPRPALWNQYDLILERDRYGANGVRPGLTGLAQINGRDEVSIDIKAKLDGDYVKNISFKNDCKIFFKTIISVIKSKGYQEGSHQNAVTSNNEGVLSE